MGVQEEREGVLPCPAHDVTLDSEHRLVIGHQDLQCHAVVDLGRALGDCLRHRGQPRLEDVPLRIGVQSTRVDAMIRRQDGTRPGRVEKSHDLGPGTERVGCPCRPADHGRIDDDRGGVDLLEKRCFQRALRAKAGIGNSGRRLVRLHRRQGQRQERDGEDMPQGNGHDAPPCRERGWWPAGTGSQSAGRRKGGPARNRP